MRQIRIAMKFLVTVDRDEDGVWVAECPSIPGCVSQGETREEAAENIREAIALCLEVRAERGLPLTVETRQIEIVAKGTLRSLIRAADVTVAEFLAAR
jgi:predicted RNase H-like HicB family nuclease